MMASISQGDKPVSSLGSQNKLKCFNSLIQIYINVNKFLLSLPSQMHKADSNGIPKK